MIPDNARKNFRMANILRANWIRGYQGVKQLCLPMNCVYVFWHDNNAACKKGIYSIHCLGFQTILKIGSKIVIIDS